MSTFPAFSKNYHRPDCHIDSLTTGAGGASSHHSEPVAQKERADTTPVVSALEALDAAQSGFAVALLELSARLENAGLLQPPEACSDKCEVSAAPAPWPLVANLHAYAEYAGRQTSLIRELMRRLAV